MTETNDKVIETKERTMFCVKCICVEGPAQCPGLWSLWTEMNIFTLYL